jgi:hypothetical protein
MDSFRQQRPAKAGDIPVSIKVRVNSGCFHREHSPKAYEIIDRHMASIPDAEYPFSFEEHESGPEVLVFLAMTTAGLVLAKSVIELITAIIKARSDGIRQGDGPNAPIEPSVRRSSKDGEFTEEKVLRVGSRDPLDKTAIEKELTKAFEKLIERKKESKEKSSKK